MQSGQEVKLWSQIPGTDLSQVTLTQLELILRLHQNSQSPVPHTQLKYPSFGFGHMFCIFLCFPNILEFVQVNKCQSCRNILDFLVSGKSKKGSSVTRSPTGRDSQQHMQVPSGEYKNQKTVCKPSLIKTCSIYTRKTFATLLLVLSRE